MRGALAVSAPQVRLNDGYFQCDVMWRTARLCGLLGSIVDLT